MTSNLLKAAKRFDLAKVRSLVLAGEFEEFNDEAFMSDLGMSLGVEDAHTPKVLARMVKAGFPVSDENEALFELYETLILAGHPVADGSSRRCLTRVIAGAKPPRQERAVKLMEKCIEEGMLFWETSAWAQQIKIDEDEKKKNGQSSGMALRLPTEDAYELLGNALYEAAFVGNEPMLRLLVSLAPTETAERVRRFSSTRSAVSEAVRGGHIGCVDFLLSVLNEADWQRTGSMTRNPLTIVAADAGQKAMLSWLLEQGHDINALSGDGEANILVRALDANQPSIVPFLLACGALPNTCVNGHPSPLQMAIWRAQRALTTIQPLLEAGSDLEYRDKGGRTALGCAGQSGQAGAVAQLLAAGADIEAVDQQGRSAMWWACSNDRLEAFQVLRAAGARMDIPDLVDQKTPADAAKGRIKAMLEFEVLEGSTPAAKGAARPGRRM